MDKIEILVVGRHPEILQTMVKLVNNNIDWNATGAGTDEEAIKVFKANTCRIVLFGGGVEAESEDKLRLAFIAINPDVCIVQHYGGGSGLLFAEIYEALNKKPPL